MPAVREIVSALNELVHGWSAVGGWVRLGAPAAASRAKPTGWARSLSDTALLERAGSEYAGAGREPPLEEVLRDPIVQLVMRADGLEPAEVGRALATGTPVAGQQPGRGP